VVSRPAASAAGALGFQAMTPSGRMSAAPGISGPAGPAISGRARSAVLRCASVIPPGRGRRAPAPGAAGSRGLR
jgi:hypothetical protein